MRNITRLAWRPAICLLIFLASEGIAVSQQAPRPVDTGVIFSAEHVEGSGANRLFALAAPYWTPSPDEIALLEAHLKPYLARATIPGAKVIAARLESYKRQYFGFTDGGKKWILVNGFCAGQWKKQDTWHDRVVVVLDGGVCFFRVRYDLLRSQFEQLQINGEA